MLPVLQIFPPAAQFGILAPDRKPDQDQQYRAAHFEQHIQDKDALGILPVFDGIANPDPGDVQVRNK